jgi:membrane protease YdiL (CAAX protease family)
MTSNVIVTKESTSLISRSVLVVFCLAAGFAYRASVSLIPTGIFEDSFLLGLAAVLLTVAVLIRRSQNLRRYWEIPFAFFVFTIAGFAGDVGISPLQQGFVQYVLHETPSANNPLASTVLGTVLVQLFSTLGLVIPIILLTKASGSDLSSIFIDKARVRSGLVVGVIGFLVFYLVTALGFAQRLFPNNGVTFSRLIELTPALLVLVLCNGLREELWFRAIFLKKYGEFLGPLSSNLLAAIIFTLFHVQVQYTPSLLPFLGITLILGLFLGYLMQRSGSILAPAIFHAGTDIPIYLVFLLYSST